MIINSSKLISNPIVSIVVITYNQENYISQCVESILSQVTKLPYEIIIAEDCGSDSTRSICMKYQIMYPEKINLLFQDTNVGLIKNYRDVLSLCRGKYVAQCAGDDYWCDVHKIQTQFECLESKTDYGFVRTGGYKLKQKKLIDISSTAHCNAEGNVFEYAKYGPVSLAASIFFERALLKYIDFEEFIKRNFSMEDYPLNAILAKHTNFAYINKKCVVYRELKNSISNTRHDEKYINYMKGYIEVKKYLMELYPEDCSFNINELNDSIKYSYLKVYFRNQQYKDAKKVILEMKTEIYKNKFLSVVTTNIFLFYCICYVMKIKNIFE